MLKKILIILVGIIFFLLPLFACQKAELTEEEQRGFLGCIEQESLNRERAFKYLRLLLKGDADTISVYEWYEKESIAKKKFLYENDICAAVSFLAEDMDTVLVASGGRYLMESKDGIHQSVRMITEEESGEIESAYKLTLEVIKQKDKYPGARLCAIKALSKYGEVREGIWYGDKRGIPVLRKALRDKDPQVKLETAGMLLSLGEGNIALPALDDIVMAGISESKAALDKLFITEARGVQAEGRARGLSAKLRDQRGKDILIRALDHSIDEIKAFAALRLVIIGAEKERSEAIAIKVLERLKNRRMHDYKDAEERTSSRKAGTYSITVLETVHSPAGTKVLKELIRESDDLILQRRAKTALRNLGQR